MSNSHAETRASSRKRPAYPRKRAVQACLTCRQRRTKCDNEKPACNSCKKLGIDCVYHEFEKASFDAASLAILRRLDELESVVKGSRPLPAAPQPCLDFASSLSSSPFPTTDIDWINSFEVRYVNREVIFNWPVWKAADLHPSSQDSPPAIFPGIDSVSRPLLVSDVDVQDASRLLGIFLSIYHIFNPVLDIPTIEEHAKSTSLNGFGWDAGSCLVLLVLALGTTVDHNNIPTHTSLSARQNENFSRAEAYFVAAQRRMGLLLSSSGIAEAQCFFLAGVYLMTTMRPADAWKMFTRALSSCHTFQLSCRDASPGAIRLQQTIHWACFKSELEVRLELGIIKTSAWDLRYPDLFPDPPESIQSQGEPAWYFYLAEIALRRLNNRILSATCLDSQETGNVADKVTMTLEFERQAHSWARSLPPSLRPAIDDSSDVTFDFNENGQLRFILSGHLIDCLELMYWPFIYAAVHGRLGDDRDSHMLASRGLDFCVRRININKTGFFHRHHGTWLMLQSCTRSALVLIAAANGGLHDKLPHDWRASVEDVVNLLKYWVDEVPDFRRMIEILASHE
ncbi:C6 zinc finger domain-containing protein [Colletotrichum scovillei]|uniref:C6 zinc finger domain-containing protein n=1 Tax=Colletotrichum scovillei TaxID=1209932 RepID=A0A9P7UJY3_9PEZI|nr:C6 zinc finger domain-containing protein [Colletotrichum scovillei]KAG7071341.1 C6 zinc finger domain-containing protein [Colletotrichum scovillei]KAG7079618.1 C6 zinc finger domain-containing protein [Colletotrichum scovillei]